MCHVVSVSSNACYNVFPPVLVELPRFKGLDWAFIFHVATDRLTLHYCVDRLPLRLTSNCTHLPDLLWGSTCLLSCMVQMNMNLNCFLSYLLEGRSYFVSKRLKLHILPSWIDFHVTNTHSVAQSLNLIIFHRDTCDGKVLRLLDSP